MSNKDNIKSKNIDNIIDIDNKLNDEKICVIYDNNIPIGTIGQEQLERIIYLMKHNINVSDIDLYRETNDLRLNAAVLYYTDCQINNWIPISKL